jgi:3-oxoacyl-[acyl-carrier-protein] synthase III
MKKKVFINNLDCYIPKTKLFFQNHLSELEDENSSVFPNSKSFLDFSQKILNIDSVNIELDLSIEQMAIKLVEKNIKDNLIRPLSINYIIIANDFDNQLVNFGHYIQYNLGMDNANVLKISGNYCTNIDLAIGMAKRIIESEYNDTQVLIICGSKLDNNLASRIVGSYAVMGDSVSLALLSNISDNSLCEIKSQEIVTKGILNEINHTKDNTLLHFQSYQLCFNQLLKNNDLVFNEIDGVILHNSNQLLVEQSLKSCGINNNKIERSNLFKYGHLGSSDLILNLNTYLNKTSNNQIISSLNLGVTGTYVGTIFIK